MSDFNRFVSVGDTIRRVLGVLGLPKFTDVASSNDATAKQMWDLITECGQDMLDAHDWQFLTRSYSITTTTALTYDLPVDFQRFVAETGWNNTSRIPLIGPLGSQTWRTLQARQLGGTTLSLQYVIENDKIVLYHVPAEEQVLTIEYVSRGWLRDAADPAVLKDTPTADSDIVLYNPRLMVSYLKHKWREAKGFDTSASYAEFMTVLDNMKSNNMPPRDLSLATRRAYPLIGIGNVSDTGYGS
jgi:hypothetical protein